MTAVDLLFPARPRRTIASPLARRIAGRAQLDLGAIRGSGPRGRIVRADVERSLAAVPVRVPAAAIPIVPHLHLTADCRIDALLEIRAALNQRCDGHKYAMTDFLVRAAARALADVPEANVVLDGGTARPSADIDVAVAAATASGPVALLLRRADRMGLAQLSIQRKAMAARAREGRLEPGESDGGSLIVWNLGMRGIHSFAALPDPPRAAMLAVGDGELRPVVRNGVVTIGTVLTCTLSADPRAIDGRVAGALLGVIRDLLEDPLLMLV